MDFLKNCMTNVLQPHNDTPSGIRFSVFKIPEETGDKESERERVLGQEKKRRAIARELAQEDMLARAEPGQNRIWCFNIPESSVSQVEAHDCSFIRNGTVEPKHIADLVRSASPPPSALHVFRLFLGAVEAVVSYQLTKICEPTRLKPMSWLVKLSDVSVKSSEVVSEHGSRNYALVSVAIRITANGSVVYLLETTPSSLRIVQSEEGEIKAAARVGWPALLAPMGTSVKFAKMPITSGSEKGASKAEGERSPTKSSSLAQASLSRRERVWKRSVRERMKELNIGKVSVESLADTAPWVYVEMDSKSLPPSSKPEGYRKQVFLWPAALCAYQDFIIAQATTDQTSLDVAESTFPESHDALAAAEEWFNGARDRLENNHTSAKQAMSKSEEEMEGLEDHELDNLLQSPVYSRGNENASAGGVYPTPPDAMVPTASSDPGPSSLTVTDVPIDELMAVEESPQLVSTRSSMDLVDQMEDGENTGLFGEGEEDDFAGPNITDADFNFFDDSGKMTSAQRQAMKSAGMSSGSKITREDMPNVEVRLPDRLTAQQPDPEDQNSVEAVLGKAQQQLAAAIPTESKTDGMDEQARKLRMHYESNWQEDKHHSKIKHHETTPPLSPFAIKERLLPLPIPASSIKIDSSIPQSLHRRRSSNYDAVNFNHDFAQTSSKYGKLGRFGLGLGVVIEKPDEGDDQRGRPSRLKGIISLPEKPNFKGRSSRKRKAKIQINSDGSSSDEDSSDDDVDDGSTDTEGLDTVNFRATKRQRQFSGPTSLDFHSHDEAFTETADVPSEAVTEDESALEKFIQYILIGQAYLTSGKNSLVSSTFLPETASLSRWFHARLPEDSPELWAIFGFDGHDLIAISQLVMQQSMIELELDIEEAANSLKDAQQLGTTSILRESAISIFGQAVQDTKCSNLSSVAAMSTTMSPTAAAPADSLGKLQPRPTPRRGVTGANALYGQYMYPIAAPFVRLQRTESPWDMLSAAVDYWDTLGLEPCNGPKDVTAYAVLVGNLDLAHAAQRYLQDLALVYDYSKLGTFTLGPLSCGHGSPAGIAYTNTVDLTSHSILAALRSSCIELAEALSKKGRRDSTTIIYLLNPFGDSRMVKYVCACFWDLCRSFSRTLPTSQPSNVVLQILPMKAIASTADFFTMPDHSYLSNLARATYDKVLPPIPAETAASNVWRINSAPSIRIVASFSRKINFVLHEVPPNNLMQEAQVIHLAYAVSADGDWLTVAWTDYTGQHQHTSSFCLARTDHYAVLSNVKDWTLSMMPDKTTWRLIVARVGTQSPRERNMWADLVSPNIAITIVNVSQTSPIQTLPSMDSLPAAPQTTNPVQPGAGFLTPVSTPQASSQTVSPDAYAANASTPSDPPADLSVPEPDAQLFDSRDQTYAVIVPFSTTQTTDPYLPKRVLASGMLLRAGESKPNQPLVTLAIDIVDNLSPKIVLGQSQWLTQRSPEGVLREVLLWYRGLATLGRVRRVTGASDGIVPWHIGVAMAGSGALDGFLD